MADPTTRSYTATQDGHEAGGVWVDTGTPIGGGSGNDLGLVFQAHSSFDPSGRPIDPAVITTGSLTLTVAVQSGFFNTFQVYLVPQPNPEPFSNSNLPSSWLIGDNRLFIPTTTPFVANFDEDGVVTIPLNFVPFRHILGSSSWSGEIAIVFQLNVAFGTAVTFNSLEASSGQPTLSLTEYPFLGGKVGPYRALGRVDRCPRCGFIRTRDTFVADGWEEGLLVCPECWDPEEPRPRFHHPRERPPIND